MKTATGQQLQPIEFLHQLISKGGPDTSDYERLNNVVNLLAQEYKTGNLSQGDIQALYNGFGQECLATTLHGHSITKPYGYAGDFMIIDKIYREHITTDQRFEKWDTFWNRCAASQAVRNRKDYFIKTMTAYLQKNESLQLLNVASGPARDLFELYSQVQPGSVNTTCVEADDRAIAYAKHLNQQHLDHIRFEHQNIFRFQNQQQFDIVWSAGLFDYFNDTIFVKLLRRFISWTKPGGEVIIGNFNTINPDRNLMELFGDWYLQHRSEEELVALAIQAGVQQQRIYVGKEPESVNLFLHIKA